MSSVEARLQQNLRNLTRSVFNVVFAYFFLSRFPILDLRPPDTRPCQPLFQKRLHEEICMIRCLEMTFESCLQFGEATAKYEFRFKAIDGRRATN